MKYLCLVYFEETEMAKWTEAQAMTCIEESGAYDQSLKDAGHYLGSNALQSVTMATTLRVRNGKLSTVDGPFAETKEQLGGYILIEARDLNEAIRIAAGIPLAKTGAIEVRPVLEGDLNPMWPEAQA
jgi:hypothetical protein